MEKHKCPACNNQGLSKEIEQDQSEYGALSAFASSATKEVFYKCSYCNLAIPEVSFKKYVENK